MNTDHLIGETFRQMPMGGWDNGRGAKGDLWHIRGVVDGRLVCRRWRRSKARWHYEVISGDIIAFMWGRAYRTDSKPVQAWVESLRREEGA